MITRIDIQVDITGLHTMISYIDIQVDIDGLQEMILDR